VPRPWIAVFALAALAALTGVACMGETRHDVYMKAMKLEGDAERGECKLFYDRELQAHTLDGDKVQECLQQIEKALAEYDRAAEMGLKDVDFQAAHARTRDRKAALEGMLKMVRQMEQPEYEMKVPDPS